MFNKILLISIFGLVWLNTNKTCKKEPFSMPTDNYTVVDSFIVDNPIIYSTLFREGVILGKTYKCPGGKLTAGAGDTQNPEIVYTVDKALDKLFKQMDYYKNIVHKRWPHLNNNQQYAVVSLAMNCKWDSVFNSSFSRSLDKKQIPNFTKYCYAKGKFYYNLYQSRLYEQALFEGKKEFDWVNPLNGYKTETTTISDLQNFYAGFWHERIKIY